MSAIDDAESVFVPNGAHEGNGRVFPNFSDPDLDDHAYNGSNFERLLNLKARYDPGNLFRFRQSLLVR